MHMGKLKYSFNILKESFKKFGADNITTKAAALSYYTIFSLPPMLLVVLWVGSKLYKKGKIETYIYTEIGDLVGQSAATQIDSTVDKMSLIEPTIFATVIGITGIVFTATTVFVTMQNSLNEIFMVRAKAKSGIKLLRMIKDRVLSFALILTIAFILLVSLALNALISAFRSNLEVYIGQVSTMLTMIISFILPLIIIGGLFMLIFRVLPDAHIKWKYCITGGIITALLFETGKYLIGIYIGQSNLNDMYETAGSLMVLLVWVYFASAIFYFGAIVTYNIAKKENGFVKAQDYATKIEKKEVEKGRKVDGI